MCYGGCDCLRCNGGNMIDTHGNVDTMTRKEDKKRQNTQCEQILAALKKGPLYNTELAQFGLSHCRRITDLREQGYNIQCGRVPNGGGLTLYRLIQA